MRIKRLYDSDYKALRMLAFCGNATTNDLLVTGITKTRLINYKNDGLIKQIFYQQRRQQRVPDSAWALTLKGRKFIAEKLHIPATNSKNSVKHNVIMAREYSKLILYHKVDVANILTEFETRELIEQLLDELKETNITAYWGWYDAYTQKRMSMPDITIRLGECRYHCIEIITNNYEELNITAKKLTAKFLGAEINIIRA
ncbi:MAG TPA: hypothetical protein PKK61_09480 [Defluviitaleaceae bacterium]|jgi:hypothetical protein|nr:hypothetical protein [Defluviitaleaceae bacterium]